MMPSLAKIFSIISRGTPPIDRDIFKETYGDASEAGHELRRLISREECQRAEAALLKVLPDHPLLRHQITRTPREDPDVIPNRQALILLYVRAEEKTRKYNKNKPSYLHSLEVTEIFLDLATRMWRRGAAIMPRDRVRSGVRCGILHDMVEDFKTSIDEIAKLFSPDIAKSGDSMTTPKLAALVANQRYAEKTKKYITLPNNLTLSQIGRYLEELKERNVGNYVNLDSSLKLQHKMEAREELSLVDCLLRGSDNIHALVSDIIDLRNGIIYIRPHHDHTALTIQRAGIPVDEMQARDNSSDRSAYQTALYDRIRTLKQIHARERDVTLEDLRIYDVAIEELRTVFETAKSEFQIEVQKSADSFHNPELQVEAKKRDLAHQAARDAAGWSPVRSGARWFTNLANRMGRQAAL